MAVRRGVWVVAVCAGVAAVSWAPRLRADDSGDGDVAPPVPVSTPTGASSPAGAGVEVEDGLMVAVPAEQVSVGPYGQEWGVPKGYLGTVAGAQAAAVGWVSSLGDLMAMGPIARSDTLRELLSSRIADETVAEFKAERERFIETFGRDPSTALWRESPLAVTVPEASDQRTVVRVWAELLMGTSERVEVLWRTHTVTLVWERDDWRVDDVSRVEGPTPAASTGAMPSPGSEFAAVEEWTPAVLVGAPSGGAGD